MSSKDTKTIYTFPGGIVPSGIGAAAGIESLCLSTAEAADAFSGVFAVPLTFSPSGSGAAAVAVGDKVFRGSYIGRADGDTDLPMFSGVSGTVRELIPSASGDGSFAVVIDSDGKFTPVPGAEPFEKRISETSPEEIVSMIRLGGVITSSPFRRGEPLCRILERAVKSGKLKRFIVNCTECGSFIASSRRLILEDPASVINGAKIILRALGLSLADLVMNENDPDAVNALRGTCGSNPLFRTRLVKYKYPQSSDRMIVNALTGRCIAAEAAVEEAGYVVVDASVCADIFRLFATGLPKTDCTVTVDGAGVSEPAVLTLPAGTPVSDVLSLCRADLSAPNFVTDGDEMTGREPITVPGVGGVLTVLSTSVLVFPEQKKKADLPVSACIRCGRCSDVCPVDAAPLYIARNIAAGNMKKAVAFGLDCCISCGACTYVCPVGIPLSQIIRDAKNAKNAKNAKKNVAEEPTEEKIIDKIDIDNEEITETEGKTDVPTVTDDPEGENEEAEEI